jgi:hypothetical protein
MKAVGGVVTRSPASSIEVVPRERFMIDVVTHLV